MEPSASMLMYSGCVYDHTDACVCLCVNLRAGSSCGHWVQCWSLRRQPPPPAASGSGWLHEVADQAASGRMCHLPMLPG